MQESLSQSHKFRLWWSRLESNGIQIESVEELYVKHRHNGEALFGLVNVHATTPEGNKLLPLCMIKGEVVSVLMALIDKETKEKYLLLVRQRRVCNGALIYEQPAGMVDKEDHPHDVAVKEVFEETGVKVSKEQIIPLNLEPHYPSTGTCDEAIYFYYCELEMSREEMQELDNRDTGEGGEHEFINTCVVPIKEAFNLITNPNGTLNIYLYLHKIKQLELLY